MHDVFISYNHSDKDAVLEVVNYLERRAGIRCFFDDWDIAPGEDSMTKIAAAIQQSKAATFFIGKQGGSKWTNFELQLAKEQANLQKLENQAVMPLIPVLLPGGAEESIPRDLKLHSRLTGRFDFRSQGVQNDIELKKLAGGIRGQSPREAGALEYASGEFRFTSKPPRQPTPQLLVALCNRRKQADQIVDVLGQNSVISRSPICCVILGTENQGHDLFVKRLIHYTLPQSLNSSPFTEFVGRIFVELPDALDSNEDFKRRIHQRVCEELNLPSTVTKAQVAQKVSAHKGPYLVSTYFYATKWHAQGAERLQLFMDYWLDWPVDSLEHPIIACICLRFSQPSNSISSILARWNSSKHREDIQKTLSSLANSGKLFALDELQNVYGSDIENWSKLSVVESVYPDLALDRRLGQVVRDRGGLPMTTAAQRLEDFLKNMANQ